MANNAKEISIKFLGFANNTQQDAHEYLLKMLDS
jgi:uncharacterized UBP type Zn finger protein